MLAFIFRFLGLRAGSTSGRKSRPPGPPKTRPLVTVTHDLVVKPPAPLPAGGPSQAAQLLKDAVQLKKEKRYDEACSALVKALSSNDDEITFAHRLRLPSYLLLAGKNDEAWRCLNELNIQFTEPEAQGAIASKMVAVLKKEGRFHDALVHECWAYSMDMWSQRKFVEECIMQADRDAVSKATDEFAWLDAGRKPNGKTPNGNPIHDCSYPSFHASLKKTLTVDAVAASVRPLIMKFANEKAIVPFAKSFLGLLNSRGKPEFVEVRNLVKQLFNAP